MSVWGYFTDIKSEKGSIMPKVAKDIVEKRPGEIVTACRKLYKTMTFQEITLKEISRETSLSRPAIYNYFQTKEEIFLALLGDEYSEWCSSLEKLRDDNESLDIESFADALAFTLKKRETMMKILCMNLYEIEEHSREEKLVEFKLIYGRSMDLVLACLSKFFPKMTEDEKSDFVYKFFPLMYGIYPYVHPTDKQNKAMKKAGIVPRKTSVYEIAYKAIIDFLSKQGGVK